MREIKFRAEDLETSISYDINTVDKPRDKRGSHNFKGRQNNGGYWIRLVEGHPNANSRGYVAEHRLVIEENLGRLLLPSEVIHHIDGDKMNNDIDNLELITNHKLHASLHLKGVQRNKKGFFIGDEKLESEKYRFYNKITKNTEIYTLSRIINTTFRNCQFEHRGKFTGLKDKNGKEIYEGDIVKNEYGENFKTEYLDGMVLPFVRFPEYKCEWAGDCEVIGNIYETPELIK